jgi:uncharacterized delta-60 repeat protein
MLKTRQELKNDKYYQNPGSTLVLSGSTFIGEFTGATSTYKNVGFDVRDLNFIIGQGFNGTVGGLAVQSDGKMLFTGSFTSYQDIPANRLVRLNIDGSLDSVFATNVGDGFNATTQQIKVSSSGSIFITGSFNTVNSQSKNRFVKLNSDGTIDTTFNAGGSGFNSSSTISVEIEESSAVWVTGNFNEYNGVSIGAGLIKLNWNGTRNSSFDIGTGFVGGIVQGIAIQSDGKIIATGSFTQFTGTTQNRIIRLNANGTKDTSFQIGTGLNTGSVPIVKLQTDGKILVGGSFTNYSGSTVNRIIRLHPNGKLDATFNIGSGPNTGSITLIHVLADGKILVGGSFTSFNGVAKGGFIRLNSNGSVDTTFNSNGVGFGSGGISNAFALTADNKYLIGGAFTQYNGRSINRFIRILTDGTADAADSNLTIKNGILNYDNTYSVAKLGASSVPPKSYVDTAYGFSNGLTRYQTTGDTPKVILGGNLDAPTKIEGDHELQFNTTRILLGNNIEGNLMTFSSSFTSPTTVYDLAFVNDIYAANETGVLKFDVSTTEHLGFAIKTNGPVNALCGTQDNKILVGGSFSKAKNVGQTVEAQHNRLLRMAGNSIDTSFKIGSGFNGQINSIVYYSGVSTNATYLIGGSFSMYSGVSVSNLVRIDNRGYLDSTFDSTKLFDNSVTCIKVLSDGKILVGGTFTTFDGTPSDKLVKLNGDGTLDGSFVVEGFDAVVNSIDIQTDNKVLVVGEFSTYGFNPSSGIARLNTDGSLDSTFNIGQGFTIPILGAVHFNAALQKIYVGGNWVDYSGNTVPLGIIALNLDGSIWDVFSGNSGQFGLQDQAQFGTPYVFKIKDNGNLFLCGAFDSYGDQNYYSKNIITLSYEGEYVNPNLPRLSIKGGLTSEGLLKYLSDYSSTYTARSLVDAGYLTGQTRVVNGLTKTNGKIRLGGVLTGTTRFDFNGLGSYFSFNPVVNKFDTYIEDLNTGDFSIIDVRTNKVDILLLIYLDQIMIMIRL